MVSAIAILAGFDPEDDRVKTLSIDDDYRYERTCVGKYEVVSLA